MMFDIPRLSEMSDVRTVQTPLGDEVSVWSYPRRVVVEVSDSDCNGVSGHMTVEQAEQHIHHVRQAIEFAKGAG